MVIASELRAGMVIRIVGQVHKVVEVESKAGGAKMGGVIEISFTSWTSEMGCFTVVLRSHSGATFPTTPTIRMARPTRYKNIVRPCPRPEARSKSGAPKE
jgi:hypothetical protein